MWVTKEMADSVSQGRLHKEAQVAFCRHCGRRYFVSFTTFTLVGGQCDCSWHCCTETKAERHGSHIEHRTATAADILDAMDNKIRDFRQR